MLRAVPVEPAPSRWQLPPPEAADRNEICGVGADLEPGTILLAYRTGLFPMRVGRGGPVGWWSPDPRGVIPLDGLIVSRSLRRSQRRFELRVDTAFEAVMRACADPARPHGWIDESFVEAYVVLHRLGWAHSVETWRDGDLVGGLYGVAIGGLFAGESMFHRASDASKVALLNTVEILRAGGATLFDVQWVTPHLESLGAAEMARRQYVREAADAIARPVAPWPEPGPASP
jgi:leucyl/phenylalanyl-tRNA--protein transferase